MKKFIVYAQHNYPSTQISVTADTVVMASESVLAFRTNGVVVAQFNMNNIVGWQEVE